MVSRPSLLYPEAFRLIMIHLTTYDDTMALLHPLELADSFTELC